MQDHLVRWGNPACPALSPPRDGAPGHLNPCDGGSGYRMCSTSNALTGTPVAGQTLVLNITDNGSGRAITWGASFEASTVALPTTTVAGARLRVSFEWNTVTRASGAWPKSPSSNASGAASSGLARHPPPPSERMPPMYDRRDLLALRDAACLAQAAYGGPTDRADMLREHAASMDERERQERRAHARRLAERLAADIAVAAR